MKFGPTWQAMRFAYKCRVSHSSFRGGPPVTGTIVVACSGTITLQPSCEMSQRRAADEEAPTPDKRFSITQVSYFAAPALIARRRPYGCTLMELI